MPYILDNTLSFGLHASKQDISMMHNFMCKSLESKGISIVELGWMPTPEKINHFAEAIAEMVFDDAPLISASIELKAANRMLPFCKDIPKELVLRLFYEKEDMDDAFTVADHFVQSGSVIFLCPWNMNSFSDSEIIGLAEKVNKSHISALYICENQGEFSENDLNRQIALLDHNLNDKTMIGLHLGISFSQGFKMIMDINSIVPSRKILVDSTILGIGKEMDYPNTELLLENMRLKYRIEEILDLMELVWPFHKQKTAWDYSPLAFLSAKERIDIEYLQYFMRKGISLKEMMSIAQLMSDDVKKYDFNQDYADQMADAWNKKTTYFMF